MEQMLQIGKYEVHLFLNDTDTQKVAFELAFENHGRDVLATCENLGTQPFHYAVITGFDWENDLSPWPAAELVSKGDSFGGGADVFLQVLVDEIVPQVIGTIEQHTVPHNGNKSITEMDEIARTDNATGKGDTTRSCDTCEYNCSLIGYSLAGLTTLYCAYQYNGFDAVGSVSGALWYPEFLEFVQQNTMQPSVKAVYLSLGDKERKTRNPYMSQVQDRTESIHKRLESEGIRSVFELNPGNHFKDEVLRIAKCIEWIYQDA